MQLSQFLRLDITPFARRQPPQGQRTDGNAHQAQRGVTDRSRHVSDLAFFALTDDHAKPGGGNQRILAHGRAAWRQIWDSLHNIYFSCSCCDTLDQHAPA